MNTKIFKVDVQKPVFLRGTNDLNWFLRKISLINTNHCFWFIRFALLNFNDLNQSYVGQFLVKLFSLYEGCNELENYTQVLQITLLFLRKLPSGWTLKKLFKFQHLSYKKVPISEMKIYSKKTFCRAEEITLFLLVIIKNLVVNSLSVLSWKPAQIY